MNSVLKDAVDPRVDSSRDEIKLEIKVENESDDEMKSEVDGSDNLKKEPDIIPVEFVSVHNIKKDEPKKINAQIFEKTDRFQTEIEEIAKEKNAVKKSPENYQSSCTPHSCSICKLDCVSTSQLKIHLRVHNGEKPYSCSMCEYTSAQKGNLANHLRTHTKVKYFVCRTCGYLCKAKDALKRHILRVHDKHKKLEIKGKVDQSETQNSHREINTKGIEPTKGLNTKDKLTNNKNTTIYSCSPCNIQFTTRTKLANHSRTHTEEKQFTCPFCNYKYARKKDVETHIIQNHNGDKPYSCHKCGYKCKLKNYLLRHVCIHTGMKTFSCSVCEFKTKDLRSLDVHMIIHGGLKPYSCKACGRKFGTWNALERHSATIQGGRRITNAECRIEDD